MFAVFFVYGQEALDDEGGIENIPLHFAVALLG